MSPILRVPWRRLGRPALALAALAGLGAAGFGALQATSLAPPARSVGTVRAGDVNIVDTATGVLDLDGPRVGIRATGADAAAPVFIGIGRADDVTAYLGTVRRAEVTRVGGSGTPTVTRAGSEFSLPDPAGVDIWARQVRATGSAELVWPDTPGQWRLVVASDGGSPAPPRVVLSWVRAPRDNPAPVWIAAGAVLLAAAAIGLVLTRRRGERP